MKKGHGILMKYMDSLTSLSEEEQDSILASIVIKEFKKGTVLLQQGDIPNECYFILEGCIRQHSIDENGKEVTANFFTEEQTIMIFNHHKQDKSSAYTFTCLEDTVAVIGDLNTEKAMYDKYNQLEMMTRKMMEESFGQVQEEFAIFIASSPEERFKTIVNKRPSLINRVPQYQLASYLGITPESLSRIKKRLYIEESYK